MARAFGWFLDALMELEPVQCCDCPLEKNCNSACEQKYFHDLTVLQFTELHKNSLDRI